MSWKKHFRVVNTNVSTPNVVNNISGSSGTTTKYSSYLPEVYAGHPNRIQRYYQYDDMDRDSDINAALDTIADFCTQSEEQNETPFYLYYTDQASETEVKLLKNAMERWISTNNFRSRLWYMFRNTIKNGDAFFIRDPETGEWLWLDHYSIEMIKVDSENGKFPEEYIVRGLEPNRKAKFGTKQADPNTYRLPNGTNVTHGGRPMGLGGTQSAMQLSGANRDQRAMRNIGQQAQDDLSVIDSDHIVHLSLSVGMDINWPFGQSILEPIFKTYKQKELLEDSIIIYRVQRAPERRVFKIDVGNMPPPRAKAHIEAIKNEIHQRRIPNKTGGGSSIMDAAYNPLCLDMNTRVPLLDGRTLSITELAKEYEEGKENWVYSCNPETGEIVPGNISWAGKTRDKAKVIKFILNNGSEFTCTEDHKIPIIGKGFVEARHIGPDDEFFPFVLENHIEGKQVYDSSSKKWNWVHDIVGLFFKKKKKHQEFTFLNENAHLDKTHISHKDFNTDNNDPRNITFMSEQDRDIYLKMAGQKVINFSDYELPMKEVNPIKAIDAVYNLEMDTGTITIDGKERWHDYHTFAIESGVFVKNSIMEDFFFAQSDTGRGSSVETLPGGDNLGEIGDLTFFTRKLARGLRIPASYLSLGAEESMQTYSDGRVGTALIQEFRFNKYCIRLQNLLSPVFDKEFKKFISDKGIEIEESLFELRFNTPQNFSKYRQIELDSSQVGVYQQISDNRFLSQRFKLKRFLNLTEDELLENEELWKEENASKLKDKTGSTPADEQTDGLDSVGIEGGDPFGGDDFGGDFGGEPDFDADLGGGDEGAEPPPE